jgi:hypothetical protein
VPVETVAQEVARWEAQPIVGPFHSRHAAPLAPHGAPAFFARGTHTVAWQTRGGPGPRAHAPGIPRPEGGPVDTAVAVWGAPFDQTFEETIEEGFVEEGEVIEMVPEMVPGWIESGGSSELSRIAPLRRPRRGRVPRVRVVGWPAGAPGPGAEHELLQARWRELRLGGASELALGGASDLPR